MGGSGKQTDNAAFARDNLFDLSGKVALVTGGGDALRDLGAALAGQVGEQATLFFYDPAGNALEFKAFADLSQVFAK